MQQSLWPRDRRWRRFRCFSPASFGSRIGIELVDDAFAAAFPVACVGSRIGFEVVDEACAVAFLFVFCGSCMCFELVGDVFAVVFFRFLWQPHWQQHR